MSYDRTYWNNGDVITAEKLNKIEDELGELAGYHDDEGGDGSQIGASMILIAFDHNANDDSYSSRDVEAMQVFSDLDNMHTFYAALFDGKIYTVTSYEYQYDNMIDKDTYIIRFNNVHHEYDDRDAPVFVSDTFTMISVYDPASGYLEQHTITREVFTVATITE